MNEPLYHIQNADINVGPKVYDRPGEMLVTKIFATHQGEAPFAGWPCVFLRLAGCDRGSKTLGCEFCDTSFQFGAGIWMEYDLIVKQIVDALSNLFKPWESPSGMVVITGGEPMIQNNLSGLLNLLDACNLFVQIESNGDRLVPLPPTGRVHLVVSPKVSAKGQYRGLPVPVQARLDTLKVLVDAREASPYHALPFYLPQIGRNKIYLSPLTVYKHAVAEDEVALAWDQSLVDHALTAANYYYAHRLATSYGFRLSMQQHLFFGQP